jgi:hypothetical protein
MDWLLLLHQVPPTPPYLRAKILRRLKQIGALPLKKSAYLLPDSDSALEDFQWLLKEIHADGGEGWILRTEAVAGLTDDSIREGFRRLRSDDYRELLVDARALRGQPEDAALRKLRKRYEEIARIDFFQAPGKQEVTTVMSEIEQSLRNASRPASEPAAASPYHARRWVTRQGIKIDRTACCWLILRFIDPAAEFAFVDPNQYTHREGDLRFDMFEGEFTHEGDQCSFEVLMSRCNIATPALEAVGEIVHDLDLKDGKFGRPEAAGVAAMIEGLGVRHSSDQPRLEEGLVLFDSLHARLARP